MTKMVVSLATFLAGFGLGVETLVLPRVVGEHVSEVKLGWSLAVLGLVGVAIAASTSRGSSERDGQASRTTERS